MVKPDHFQPNLFEDKDCYVSTLTRSLPPAVQIDIFNQVHDSLICFTKENLILLLNLISAYQFFADIVDQGDFIELGSGEPNFDRLVGQEKLFGQSELVYAFEIEDNPKNCMILTAKKFILNESNSKHYKTKFQLLYVLQFDLEVPYPELKIFQPFTDKLQTNKQILNQYSKLMVNGALKRLVPIDSSFYLHILTRLGLYPRFINSNLYRY